MNAEILIYPEQMDLPANQAKVYRAVLHQDSFTYRRMQTYWDIKSRWIPLLIKPKIYRALLHQDSISYRRMQTYWDTQSRWIPLLIEPKCTEPYYTRTVLPIEECRFTEIPREDGPPANEVKVYRTLLDQDSITYGKMQTYWDTQSRQSPTIQAKVYRALLHQDSITYRRMQMYWDTQSRQPLTILA